MTDIVTTFAALHTLLTAARISDLAKTVSNTTITFCKTKAISLLSDVVEEFTHVWMDLACTKELLLDEEWVLLTLDNVSLDESGD